MLRLFLVSLVLVGCVHPQAPLAPVAAVTLPAKPAAPSLISRLTAMPPAPLLGTCESWGADSVLCHPSPTSVLWCSAPQDGKPTCERVLDWTPPPPAPTDTAPKAEIPKSSGPPLKKYPEKK